jgi:hypothetical protein
MSRICVPDKWKEGPRSGPPTVGAIRPGKTNKLIEKRFSAQWIPEESNCRLCRSKVQKNMHYCNDCALKKGICSMCGKKILDTKSYRMSLT